ncbi:uncharacterized protein LOC144077528 isoform X2 [Stigmatopora argus]
MSQRVRPRDARDSTKPGLPKYFRCLSRRRRERHQEYVCGTRTSFHSVVGAYSTVCAKGPTHTPTKLGPAKYFRCLSRRRRERHQEYVCGTRTSFHSAVGACSTVCAKGPTHTPTKLRPAKNFR